MKKVTKSLKLPKWKIPVSTFIAVDASIIVEAATAKDAVQRLLNDKSLFPKDPVIKVFSPQGAKVSRRQIYRAWEIIGEGVKRAKGT